MQSHIDKLSLNTPRHACLLSSLTTLGTVCPAVCTVLQINPVHLQWLLPCMYAAWHCSADATSKLIAALFFLQVCF